jgi:alpha-beta hydrolase superfamily lysophospholipase
VNVAVNMVNGWLWQTEFVAAFTRKGQHPGVLMSVALPGSEEYDNELAAHKERLYPADTPIPAGKLARAYLKRYHDLDGLILSGTPSYQAAVVPAGLLISGIEKFRGERYRSNLVNKLFFGAFNHKIKNPASTFAWLNTDAAAVAVYDKDPLCGFLFTLNGFASLRSLLIDVNSPRGWVQPRKNMPVLFVSGGDDPCMISREKLSEAVNLLRNVGYAHIKVKVYDGMRHEILNEPQRDKVYADIAAFLEECRIGAKA